MFELAKSAASFGWAVSLFGAQQIGRLILQPDADTARKSAFALMTVTGVAVSNLDQVPGAIFRAGVQLQNAMPLDNGSAT